MSSVDNRRTGTSPAPRIAIIGRPNVGKSTLFNRLVGRRRALVHDEPGVTRDRLEMAAKWWVRARPFDVKIVDTGGVGGDRFADEIRAQVEIALQQCDAVVAVFDGQAGLTPADESVIREFQRSGLLDRVPCVCAVNKVDAEVHEDRIAEFYALGLDPVLTISAEHGRGIEDLQETLARLLGLDLDSPLPVAAETDEAVAAESPPPGGEENDDYELGAEGEAGEESEDDAADADAEFDPEGEAFSAELAAEHSPRSGRAIRVAIMGRPNVGKSTLVNALLGEERMITSPIAGTTVDAVDSPVELNGKPYLIIDTAGIRRKSRTEQGVEVLSVVQARKALERADVAILMIDGTQGVTDQDEKIGSLIEEAGVSVILAVNKWDTQRATPQFTKQMAAEWVRKEMGYLRYAPILFLSAKERRGFENLGDLIEEIMHQRELKIATHEFTEWIRRESTVHNPANAKFFLCHQTGRFPPTFVCHVNDPDKIHFSLRRHLLNALRERWGFMGSPVRLLFVEGKNRRSLPKSVGAKRGKRPGGAAASSSAGKS